LNKKKKALGPQKSDDGQIRQTEKEEEFGVVYLKR
jgi:hypothetical protein